MRVALDPRLAALGARPTAGSVRGLGLFAAVELVKDKASRGKFAETADEVKFLGEELIRRGLLTRATHTVLLSPPLCLTADQVARIVEIVDGAIGTMERKFGYA